MSKRRSRLDPFELPILFILIVGIPLAALGWLEWRVLGEDREREGIQLEKRLDAAVDLAVRALDRNLSLWKVRSQHRAQDDNPELPKDTAILVLNSEGLLTRYGRLLPYYPHVVPPLEASDAIFDKAEEKEFRGDMEQAIVAYRTLAQDPDARIRAAALLRLGRCLNDQHRFSEALSTDAELALMSDTPVCCDGEPSELVARRQRVLLFKTLG